MGRGGVGKHERGGRKLEEETPGTLGTTRAQVREWVEKQWFGIKGENSRSMEEE